MVEPIKRGAPSPFAAARPVRAFEAVVAQLRKLILDGYFPPGARLPAQRELAEQLAVSRNTVLQAIRVLERMGLLVVKPGQHGGAFVRALDGRSLLEPLDLMIKTDRISVQEVVELRVLIEGRNAFWAAERATPDQIAEIRVIVEEFARLVDNASDEEWSILLAEDALFHEAVARAGQNRASAILMRGLLAHLNKELQKVPRDAGHQGLEQLAGIYTAISSRAPALAETRMRQHIEDFFAISTIASNEADAL